jgi:hypothetical protein
MADNVAVRRRSDNSAGNEPAKEALVTMGTDDVPERYKTMHWG